MKKLSGFTLVEVIITVGIFMLIMVVIVDLFLKNNSVVRTQEASIDVIGGARKAMSDIHSTARVATGVESSHEFAGTVYYSATSTLILEVPSIKQNGDIIPGIFDYIAYHLSGGSLYRLTHVGAGYRQNGTSTLSAFVASFTVDYDTYNVLQASSTVVDLQTQKVWGNSTVQTHLNERIYFRNK